jgi:hypothetical protein
LRRWVVGCRLAGGLLGLDELLAQAAPLVAIHRVLERREEFLLLFLDVVLDAALQHLDGGTESRHVDQFGELVEALASEPVLDLGLLLVLGARPARRRAGTGATPRAPCGA